MATTITSAALSEQGYDFVDGSEVLSLVDPEGANWKEFADFWNDMGEDPYLQGDYMFRNRRFGQLGLVPSEGRIWLREHAAFFQPVEVNKYAGGIERRFDPLTEEIVTHPVFSGLITSAYAQFGIEPEFADAEWHVDINMFRLKVDTNRITEPTPEGIHRDGYPFGVIHVVNRHQVEGGVSHVYTNDEQLLNVRKLEPPMDSLYAWDNRVKHFATPLFATTPAEGYRDILGYVFYLPGTKYEKA